MSKMKTLNYIYIYIFFNRCNGDPTPHEIDGEVEDLSKTFINLDR